MLKILLLLSLNLFIVADVTFASCAQESVFKNIKEKNWKQAEKLAKNSKSIPLLKIVLSQKYLDKSFNNKFEEVSDFLTKNPHWPQQNKLKESAEYYITDNTDIQKIRSWFTNNIPQTGNGYKYRAISYAKSTKDLSKISDIIREGWIYGDFSIEEEQNYLKNFKKYLTNADYIKRIDEHLWSEDIEEAVRSFKKVDQNYQKSFALEIAIMKGQKYIDEAFAQIEPHYYTSGLLYKYLLHKKKQKHIPDENILEIISHIKPDYKHSDEWTILLCYYAREYIEQQKYHAAYKVISKHFAISDEQRREAEWLAGWISLSHLKNADIALKHFHKFSAVAKTPISMSRGYYWLARSYEKKGDKNLSAKFFKNAARFGFTFYGQLASTEIGMNRIQLPARPKIQDHHSHKFEKNDIVVAAKLLLKNGNAELAHLYAKAAIAEAASDGEIVLITEFIKNNYNVNYLVDIAKIASQNHVFLKEYSFPTPYKINQNLVEESLVYSIIRQESVFNSAAVSNRNAMGLMQMIADTACRTAKNMKIKCDVPKLTKDPKYNMKLGTYHLKELLEEKNGSYLLTIVSYDTAPKNVQKWIRLFGDPRTMKNFRDVVDWMESIPFAETRNYAQRVLENLQLYRTILSKNSKLRLKDDLVGSLNAI
jgi:soluble lytic murein transglycosylase